MSDDQQKPVEPGSSTPEEPGKYGLRYEDMSAEELEYYREFWQPPAPDPDYTTTEGTVYAARLRMLTGMLFILLLVCLFLAAVPWVLGQPLLSIPGAIATFVTLGCLILVRRRSFSWLRAPGQEPIRSPHSRWFIFAHTLLVLGILATLVSFTVIPVIYAQVDPVLRRNYVILWNEIGFFGLLLAALAYGITALAAYSPADDSEEIIRPTDFEEKYPSRKDDDDFGGFYDSDWLRGKK